MDIFHDVKRNGTDQPISDTQNCIKSDSCDEICIDFYNQLSSSKDKKSVANLKCRVCDFDPIAFAASIPDFERKLASGNEFGKGGELENWRGALKSKKVNICWDCAH